MRKTQDCVLRGQTRLRAGRDVCAADGRAALVLQRSISRDTEMAHATSVALGHAVFTALKRERHRASPKSRLPRPPWVKGRSLDRE